jgi:sulfur-oxidizing protein SoxZ
LLGFRVRGAKAGEKVVISWEDNKGEKDRAEATIA